LLGLGLLMMAAIWWWMTRRPAQARGKSDIIITPVGGGRSSPPVPGRAAATGFVGGPGVAAPGVATPGVAAGPAASGFDRPGVAMSADRDSGDAAGAVGTSRFGSPGTARSTDAGGRAPEEEWRAAREWGVPPLEPLSIKTALADRGAADLDLPVISGGRTPPLDEATVPVMKAHGPAAGAAGAADLPRAAAPEQVPLQMGPPDSAAPEPAPQSVPQPVPARVRVSPAIPPFSRPASGPAAARAPAPSRAPAAASAPERQRIITLRVSAAGDALWPGAQLAAVFETLGLTYGRYQVFHRKHSDGRTLFCVASLVEPGSFDLESMPADHFRGLTLFAVLPGPVTPLQTLDLLLSAAHDLSQELAGVVQDGRGQPLTLQRASSMREDVARFQASLP